MSNSTLKALLKSKLKENQELEKLIDAFIKEQGKLTKDKTDIFLTELMVYILKNANSNKDNLLKLVEAKLSHLQYDVSIDALELIYAKTAIEASKAGIKFTFDKVDVKALESMSKNFIWLKEDGSRKVQKQIKDAVTKAFKGDLKIRELGSHLKEKFGSISKQSESYFQGVADHIIRQNQNIARLRQYEKSGSTHIQIRAKIDERTSDVCRSMHGRVIEIAHVSNQADNIINAKTVEEKKKASAWTNGVQFTKLPANFGLPPYHFRCRTSIVSFNSANIEVDGKKTTGSKTSRSKFRDKEVIFSHIDKTGVERVVTRDTYEHKSNSYKPPKKDLISAMNSITEIAPHANEHGRYVALTQKNIVLVYKDQELWTAVQLASKTKAKNYFKASALKSQQEIIKWKKENLLSRLMNVISSLKKSL